MLTIKDIAQSINTDYPLSYVAEVLRENLVSLGLLKNYKWKKKIAHQKDYVFNALKNSLIDNEASIVFINKPSPKLLVMSAKTLASLTGDVWFSDEDRKKHENWVKNHGPTSTANEVEK